MFGLGTKNRPDTSTFKAACNSSLRPQATVICGLKGRTKESRHVICGLKATKECKRLRSLRTSLTRNSFE
jgi:hypothetical protein